MEALQDLHWCCSVVRKFLHLANLHTITPKYHITYLHTLNSLNNTAVRRL